MSRNHSADLPLTGLPSPELSRSLACLARFGETVTLLALPHELVLTTLSPAKSAHAKVAFGADFFVEWSLLSRVPRRGVTCDLNIKASPGCVRSPAVVPVPGEVITYTDTHTPSPFIHADCTPTGPPRRPSHPRG